MIFSESQKIDYLKEQNKDKDKGGNHKQKTRGQSYQNVLGTKKSLELKKAPGKKQDSRKYCLKTNPAVVSLSLFKYQAKFQAS